MQECCQPSSGLRPLNPLDHRVLEICDENHHALCPILHRREVILLTFLCLFRVVHAPTGLGSPYAAHYEVRSAYLRHLCSAPVIPRGRYYPSAYQASPRRASGFVPIFDGQNLVVIAASGENNELRLVYPAVFGAQSTCKSQARKPWGPRGTAGRRTGRRRDTAGTARDGLCWTRPDRNIIPSPG